MKGIGGKSLPTTSSANDRSLSTASVDTMLPLLMYWQTWRKSLRWGKMTGGERSKRLERSHISIDPKRAAHNHRRANALLAAHDGDEGRRMQVDSCAGQAKHLASDIEEHDHRLTLVHRLLVSDENVRIYSRYSGVRSALTPREGALSRTAADMGREGGEGEARSSLRQTLGREGRGGEVTTTEKRGG